MPNTLAHLGVAGLLTRWRVPDADLRWVYLGAILPDLPWIMFRLTALVGVDLPLYDLKLYFIAQASLFFCVLISIPLACFSEKRLQTFLMLVAGSFIHLLLDAFQIKWANGVHLFAPLSWRPIRFDFFWPESLPTYLLTAYGLFYLLWTWRQSLGRPLILFPKSIKTQSVAALFLMLYVLLPFAFLEAIASENNHFIRTLRNTEERTGAAIEFDRISYVYEGNKGRFLLPKGESLRVSGLPLTEDAKVSIQGHFISKNHVQVTAYHVHRPNFRDGASYLGLVLVTALWGFTMLPVCFAKKE